MENDPELCSAANIIANLNKEFSDLQDENEILKENILYLTNMLNKPEVRINTLEEWNNFSIEIENIKLLINTIHNSQDFINMLNEYGPIDIIWRCYNYTEEEDIIPDYSNYRSDRLYYPLIQHMKSITNNLNNNWIDKKMDNIITILNDTMNLLIEKTEFFEFYENWIFTDIFTSLLVHHLVDNNEGIFSEVLSNLRYYVCRNCKKYCKYIPDTHMLCMECRPN